MSTDQTIYDPEPGDAEMINGLATTIFELVISERTDDDGDMLVRDLFFAATACQKAADSFVEAFIKITVRGQK